MGTILNRKNRLVRLLTSRSDGPQGGGHGWHATKTPGAFLRASPEGVKHMDVLSTKKPDQYLCQGQAATYHSTPVCHPRYNLPRLA
jgi:hypothetical protein